MRNSFSFFEEVSFAQPRHSYACIAEASRKMILCLEDGTEALSPLTKEKASLRLYSGGQEWGRLQGRARDLLNTAELTLFREKIGQAIERRKIFVRKDREIHADMGQFKIDTS